MWLLFVILIATLCQAQEEDSDLATISPEDAPPKISPKIVGGMAVTDLTAYAYQVSLRFYGSHFCGGSIIDPRHVLTAAHCCFLEGNLMSAEVVTVVVGELYIKQSSSDSVTRTVEKFIPHENYDSSSIVNDIAILRISPPFGQWTDTIKPINLALTTPPDDILCTVSGWGYTTEAGTSVSSVLQSVMVKTINRDTCNSSYSGLILTGMFCAGDLSGGKDACQGDSGGPLVCDAQLAGVVSWGYGCAREGYPGVYADIAHYMDWIQEHVGGLSTSSAANQVTESSTELNRDIFTESSATYLVINFILVYISLPIFFYSYNSF